jgi:23S rRNA pseudouridine1911/1915/1917 synthase
MTNKIRLHKYVNEYLHKNNLDYTNSDVQKNIQKHGVLINQELLYNRLEWIFTGEKIDISHWPQRDHGSFDKIKVLLYNSNFLLVYKPAGVVTEAGAGHKDQNLVNFLQLTYGKKTETFLPVHRLDKDTQGLIIIAKNEETHTFLQDQFRNRSVSKKYLTVLDGTLDKSVQIKAWQSRNLHNPLKQIMFWEEDLAKQYSELARNTESLFRPIAVCKEKGQTLVEVEIKTGRMHQIRLQAEAIGLPVKNDKVYNNKHGQDKFEKVTLIDEPEYSQNKPILITANQLEELEKDIFEESGSFLACNYLEFTDTNLGRLCYKYKNLDLPISK